MKLKQKCFLCERIIPMKDRTKGVERYNRSAFTGNFYCCREDCLEVYRLIKLRREAADQDS